MSIGAGFTLLFIAAGLLIAGCSIFSKNKKAAAAILTGAALNLCICVLLLTGVYDPYSQHIR
jgi:high-affinity Fe2+/Pb2+ permease